MLLACLKPLAPRKNAEMSNRLIAIAMYIRVGTASSQQSLTET